MTAVEKPVAMTVEEYLAGEELTEVRHEFLGGDVYAMEGATDRHNILAGNLFASLHAQLRGGPCTAFINDMKIHLRSQGDDYFYYPDVMIARDPTDNAPLYRERPSAIIEVMSDSTERVDRREKWFAFRTIPSLRHYVLVDQKEVEVTAYRRDGEGWSSKVLRELVDLLELDAVKAAVPLADIYERSGV